MDQAPSRPMSNQNPKLVRIDCPEDIFDVPGAFIMRRKRVAVWKLDSIKAFKPGQEDDLKSLYAELIPQWHGVLDVDNDEPLANLEDDPDGIFMIDAEQLTWLTRILQASPNNLPKSTSVRTS
ncbi:MAG: hypothetical protein KJ063_02160 [Anaerolineae bacterium]|nr:hypothetical protein [Anaerolineae bacterium]